MIIFETKIKYIIMAYTGDNSYERQIYDKLIKAGIPDSDANIMARMCTDNMQGGLIRKIPESRFMQQLKIFF